MTIFGGADAMINTQRYDALELVLFGVGCLGWVVAYVVVLRRLLTEKFVEIPAAAVMANIAWEFVWGFFYRTDMGSLFQWGYRMWFFLDIVIVIGLFKYGLRQIQTAALRPFFAPSAAFGIAAWAVALYFFVGNGYDTSTGATSGYILNVLMSALYIVVMAAHPNVRDFSVVVAWSKFIGSATISVFCLLVWPDKTLLLTLCAITFLLDVAYIAALQARIKADPR